MAINIDGKVLSSTGTILNLASGSSDWMSVNANGIMTQPQRPYMKAILSGQGTFYRASPVTFGSVAANVGNCWNNATGYFTCPIAGRYIVGMSGIAAGGAHGNGFTYGYFDIVKNGSTYHYSHWNHASYWEYANLSGIVTCEAGDTISFTIRNTTGYWYGTNGHGNFFIALLR